MGKVLFSQEDFDQLQMYVRLLGSSEIACMGYAELAGGDVRVNEVFLVPQIIDPSAVEFVDTGLPYAVQKADKEGRLEELRFCWHSHGNHGAFFSTTDEDMVRKIRDAGPIPWFCSAILNARGETHAQLDVFQPGLEGPLAEFTDQVTVELDFTVEGSVLTDAESKAIEDIEHFCTKMSDIRKREAKERAKSGKAGSHQSGSSSKHKNTGGSQDGSSKRGQSLQTTQLPSEWSQPSGRDERLHETARLKGWQCYVETDTDIAHYWSESGDKAHYEGSAPIPLDKDGDWAIDVDQTVIDASPIDSKQPTLVPIDKLNTMGDEAVARLEAQGRL